jgi:hypothetical protein
MRDWSDTVEQRVCWQAKAGTTYTYRVVPMIGASFDGLEQDEAGASDWTATLSLRAPANAPVLPYFNRGIVSTQSVARDLAPAKVRP